MATRSVSRLPFSWPCVLASPSVCIDKVRQASCCIRQELSDDPLPESYVHTQTLASEFPNPTQDIELHCNSTVGQICVGAAYKHMASGALSPHAVLPLSVSQMTVLILQP